MPDVEDELDDDEATVECYCPALATLPGYLLFPCPFFHLLDLTDD